MPELYGGPLRMGVGLHRVGDCLSDASVLKTNQGKTMTNEEMAARLAVLYAAQEAATGWGATVGVRHEEIEALESRIQSNPPENEPYVLVGWFNAHNDYHGFQQVHADHEGSGDTFPLYCRREDLEKTGLPLKKPATPT